MKGIKTRIGRKISPKHILEAGFEKIEDNFPKAASFFNYVSKGRLLQINDFFEIIERDHKLLEPKYRPHFSKLTENIRGYDVENLKNVRIPIRSGFVYNAVIHGHIKAPISVMDGYAFGFAFPKKDRLPWGDVYPMPIKRTLHISGDVIFVPNLNNIFHLMIEHILPPFAFIIRNRDKNLFNQKITFVTQVDFPLLRLLAGFLNSVGYTASIVHIRPYEKAYVDRVIISRAVSSDGDLNYAYAEEMEQLRNYIDKLTADILVPEICYIKRTNTPRRNILNQDQFVLELGKYGIESYEFNFKNFLKQIAIFSKAKIIISGNGAALTNAIWSNGQQEIVELFSEDRRPKAMLNISSQHNLRYHPLIGSHEVGNGHYYFDIDKTIGYIRKISD